MDSTVPISLDLTPEDFKATPNTVNFDFFGFSFDTNEENCPYSNIYPTILPEHADDYFSDNAFMDMYNDIHVIQQLRSAENSQKELQDCNTQQVIN